METVTYILTLLVCSHLFSQASATAGLHLRLEEITVSSSYGYNRQCCGRTKADTSECLSVCPYRLRICMSTNARQTCSDDFTLEALEQGVYIPQIGLDYIQPETVTYLQLLNDEGGKDMVTDIAVTEAEVSRQPLLVGTLRHVLSAQCQGDEHQCSVRMTLTVTCDKDYEGDDCSVYCPFQNCSARTSRGQRVSVGHPRSMSMRTTRRLSCPDNRCKNFGRCTNATCICLPGFTGDLCETDILECDSDPCDHGRCIEPIAPNLYTCECEHGYTGTHCNESTTSDNPTRLCPDCYYNKTCYIEPVGADRSPGCPENMFGSHCNVMCTEQDSCGGGHFVCDPDTGDKMCKGGWGSHNCTVRAVSKACDSECPNVRCKNDGICFNGTCCCQPKYTGKYCEQEILHCETTRCQNSGTCINSPNGYTCHCPTGYTGTNCDYLISTHSHPLSSPTTRVVTTRSTRQSPPTPSPSTMTTTKPTPKSSTNRPPATTAKPGTSHDFLVDGKIKDNDIRKLEKLLNNSFNDLHCTKGARIIDHQHLVDDNRDQVTKVTYTSDCLAVGPQLMPHLNSLIVSTDPFRGNGNHLSGVHGRHLMDLAMGYSLNLIGYVYVQSEDAISKKIIDTWNSHLPNMTDIKMLPVIIREYYVGDYGTHVTQLIYFMTSHSQLLDARTTTPPDHSSFAPAFNRKPVINGLYTGVQLYDYSDGIRLPVMDTTSSITSLITPLSDVWTTFVKSSTAHQSTPRAAGGTTVGIVLSGRELCFYGNNLDLQSSVYFPVQADGSLWNDLDHKPNTTGVVTNVCSMCPLLRQIYVDIIGRVKLRDLDAVHQGIRDTWTHNGNQVMFAKKKEYFQNSKGELVTRLWYTNPSAAHHLSTVWPHPNLNGRWNISGNLTQALNTLLLARLYHVVLRQDIPQGRSSDVVRVLHQTWVKVNTHVDGNLIHITTNSWNSNLYASDGSPVTRIDYKVVVMNADSSDVAVDEPDMTTIITAFGQASLQVCNCLAYKQRNIGIVGKVKTSDKSSIEKVIKSAWEAKNQGFSVMSSAFVKDILKGYKTEAGAKATKVVYFVVSLSNGTEIDEGDLEEPDLSDIKGRMETDVPGTTVAVHPIHKSKSDKDIDEKTWIIPAAVATGLLLLVIIIGLITMCMKRRRQKASKTLNQNPERVEGYDKEHFSEAPDLDSSLNVEDPQWMDNSKHTTYVVNM